MRERVGVERVKSDRRELGRFADPGQFHAPVCIEGWAAPVLLKMLRDMLVIRYAEEAIAELVVSGEAKCPCHLGIGQEAVAVGVSSALNSKDRVFGAHRSHSHFLALGGSLNSLFSEVLGRETGCSKGMGGSMHLVDTRIGFFGSVPIVGATIPIATGAALALKMDGGPQVAVSYFGDGACEEGVLHESLNLAATMKLPILFVCENNLYSSHLDIGLRQPTDSVARFAAAHTIPAVLIDGNDIDVVASVVKELVSEMREGAGPAFIEAATYRWRGHVGPSEDVDVGVRRKAGDLDLWKQRDPVARLVTPLLESELITMAEYQGLQQEVRTEVGNAVMFARTSPYPAVSELLSRVYVDGASL